MRISEKTIEEVSAHASLVEIAGEYTRLVQRGGAWWGCCPFHNEKTPSFNIMPEKNVYHCFGCGASGTVISFVMEMEKLSFPEAVEALARKNGIEVIYEGGGGESLAAKARDNTRQLLTELYGRIAGTFHYLLTETAQGKNALSYLQERKIAKSTIKDFNLGYCPQNRTWLYDFLAKKGYTNEFLASSGLFSKRSPKSCIFAGRLMFPIADRRGRVVAFGGRILSGEGPKYINSGDLPQYKKGEALFGFHLALPQVREKKAIILCEGYMDVLAFHQAGVSNVVAPLGTAFTEAQGRLAHSFAETAILCLDGDAAGRKAARAAILTCRKSSLEARVIDINRAGFSGCKDPADILKNYGEEALNDLEKKSMLDIDYLILNAESNFNLATPEGKAKACGEIFPYLEALDSDVRIESVVSRAAAAFGVSESSLYSDFQKRDGHSGAVVAAPEKRMSGAGGGMNAEVRAMLSLACNPELFPAARSEVSSDDIESPAAKDIFILLEECFRRGALSFDTIFASCKNEALRTMMATAYASGEFSVNAAEIVADSVRLIKKNALEKKKAAIIAKMKLKAFSIESSGDAGDADMIAQIHEIDEKLKELKGA